MLRRQIKVYSGRSFMLKCFEGHYAWHGVWTIPQACHLLEALPAGPWKKHLRKTLEVAFGSRGSRWPSMNDITLGKRNRNMKIIELQTKNSLISKSSVNVWETFTTSKQQDGRKLINDKAWPCAPNLKTDTSFFTILLK